MRRGWGVAHQTRPPYSHSLPAHRELPPSTPLPPRGQAGRHHPPPARWLIVGPPATPPVPRRATPALNMQWGGASRPLWLAAVAAAGGAALQVAAQGPSGEEAPISSSTAPDGELQGAGEAGVGVGVCGGRRWRSREGRVPPARGARASCGPPTRAHWPPHSPRPHSYARSRGGPQHDLRRRRGPLRARGARGLLSGPAHWGCLHPAGRQPGGVAAARRAAHWHQESLGADGGQVRARRVGAGRRAHPTRRSLPSSPRPLLPDRAGWAPFW